MDLLERNLAGMLNSETQISESPDSHNMDDVN